MTTVIVMLASGTLVLAFIGAMLLLVLAIIALVDEVRMLWRAIREG